VDCGFFVRPGRIEAGVRWVQWSVVARWLPLTTVMTVDRIDDLIAWQLADRFKTEVYGLIRRNASASADRAFSSQLRAAAASAAMNIGEGFYRYQPRDFARFLSIALASLGEATLWLRDGIQREYFAPTECEPVFQLATRCRIATLRLRRYLVEKRNGGRG
jgi:four helix bundle protein